MTQVFDPEWSLPPGVILRHILEVRGITPTELAETSGLSHDTIVEILDELSGITPDISRALERALDVPLADFWIRLNADYRNRASGEI